ncbi:MAG: hypothetical protein ABI600_01040 [Luteolibacter sp.]
MTLPSLSTPPTHDDVQAVFKYYAAAYVLMESIQHPKQKPDRSSRLLPTGDQKTGCIGEYWAMRYARAVWQPLGDECTSFGHHSQKGWDISVKVNNQLTKYIQVKTASAFGKGKLGAIRRPDSLVKERKGRKLPDYWDELWILYLGKDFLPVGFWRIEDPSVIMWQEVDPTSPSTAGEISASREMRGKTVPSLAGKQTRPWTTEPLSDQIASFRNLVGLPPLCPPVSSPIPPSSMITAH